MRGAESARKHSQVVQDTYLMSLLESQMHNRRSQSSVHQHPPEKAASDDPASAHIDSQRVHETGNSRHHVQISIVPRTNINGRESSQVTTTVTAASNHPNHGQNNNRSDDMHHQLTLDIRTNFEPYNNDRANKAQSNRSAVPPGTISTQIVANFTSGGLPNAGPQTTRNP